MNLDINNSKKMLKHLEEMNKELKSQLKQKDEEIQNIKNQHNINFNKKLRKENERDELTEFKLSNPYDKKPSNKKVSRLTMSPLDRNNSNYTQLTNLDYSKEQSMYSAVNSQQNMIILNKYLVPDRTGADDSQAHSLEDTFVSKPDEYGSGMGRHKNSISNEYRSDNYQAEVRAFNKNKESGAGMHHNMTFGEANQQFRHKISEKKVGLGSGHDKSQYSDQSNHFRNLEASLTQDLLETKDLQASLQENSAKAEGDYYTAFLAKVSDSGIPKKNSFDNTNLQNNLTPKNLQNLNPNAKNSSSTELTRGGAAQENPNNEADQLDQTNQVQKKSNFTFHLSNSQKIKSQHSLCGKTNFNFYKQGHLKQSNSDTQNNFAYLKQETSPMKQTFSLPFSTNEHKTSPNSPYHNPNTRSPDFVVNKNQQAVLLRVTGKELEGIALMGKAHVAHLVASLRNCGEVIRQNRAMQRKSRKMMSYTRELEKKVKVVSQICERISKRNAEKERLCKKYSETILAIMKKLSLLSTPQNPISKDKQQMQNFGNILEQVGQVLSQQNIDKFKSFLSHQNQFKESMLMSPPKRKTHVRRTSSMKSFLYNTNSKQRMSMLSPFNDSQVADKKKQMSSLFSQPVPKNKFGDNANDPRKDPRSKMRRSEVIQKKIVDQVSREIKQKGDVAGKNLINRFDRDSNLGESLNEYANSYESSMDELFKDVMTSENISNHQSRFQVNFSSEEVSEEF